MRSRRNGGVVRRGRHHLIRRAQVCHDAPASRKALNRIAKRARQVERKRRYLEEDRGVVTNASSLVDLAIPPSHATLDGDPFVLKDSGLRHDRIGTMGTQANMEFVGKCAD